MWCNTNARVRPNHTLVPPQIAPQPTGVGEILPDVVTWWPSIGATSESIPCLVSSCAGPAPDMHCHSGLYALSLRECLATPATTPEGQGGLSAGQQPRVDGMQAAGKPEEGCRLCHHPRD